MTWTPRPQKPPFADPPDQIDIGQQVIRLLGPFRLYGTDSDFNDAGYVLTPLEADTVVFQIGVITTQQFDVPYRINIGGEDYAPPDEDNGAILTIGTAAGPSGGNGYQIGPSETVAGADPETDPDVPVNVGPVFAIVTTSGALLASSVGTATQGIADIYVFVASPA